MQVTMSDQCNEILCKDKLKVYRNLLPLSTASLNFYQEKAMLWTTSFLKYMLAWRQHIPKLIIVKWWYTKKSGLFSIKNYLHDTPKNQCFSIENCLRRTKTFPRILLVVFNVLGTRTTCNCNTIGFDWWEPGINSHFKLWNYIQ